MLYRQLICDMTAMFGRFSDVTRRIGGLCIMMMLLILAACGDGALSPEALLQPPRAATQTAQAELLETLQAAPTAAPTTVLLPTWTPISAESLRPDASTHEVLTVWINETSPEHRAVAEGIGTAFEAQHDVQVEFVFVDPQNVVPLARSARLTERLPDVIFHSWEQTAGLLTEAILDVDAADQVVASLSAEAFAPGALDRHPLVDGAIPAIPSDGWQYLIVYRKDWFADAGLQPPDSFERLMTAAATFDTISFDDAPEPTLAPNVTPTPEPPLRSGIVVPTEQDMPSTQRAFEWFATANGCQLASTDGEIIFEQPACLEALEFYRELINEYGPPDFQTDVTALKAFVDQRTAMAILPPSSLAYFAENGGSDLTENVGIVTELTGYPEWGETTSFANLSYVGIVTDALPIASAFAEFWFSDAYGDWIQVEPERKVPLWLGQDGEWVEAWRSAALASGETLDQAYSEQGGVAFTMALTDGLIEFERWGINTGREALAAKLYEELTIAPVLTRMLNGYIGSYQAILDANEEIFEAAADLFISSGP